MIIVSGPQRLGAETSQEWLNARAGVITASRVADLMARTKTGVSASRRAMITTLAIERITGVTEDTFVNAAMHRGTALEPEARVAYERHIGGFVEEIGLALHDTHNFVGASVDGLVGGDGIVEIKCPSNPAKHVDALLKGAHAREYRWQILTQMFVTGRKWVDAVSYDPRFPDGGKLAVVRVERDEAAIADLRLALITANEEIEQLVRQLRERIDWSATNQPI